MYKVKRVLAMMVSSVIMSLFFSGCGANSVDVESKVNSIDFQGAYDYAFEQCKSRYEGDEWEDSEFTDLCTISSDESCIKIDVYCEDVGTGLEYSAEIQSLADTYFSMNVEDAMCIVQDINSNLGLSEAVYESMGQTSGLDGKQSKEENGVIVTWKYKSKDYFNVMYTKAQ